MPTWIHTQAPPIQFGYACSDYGRADGVTKLHLSAPKSRQRLVRHLHTLQSPCCQEQALRQPELMAHKTTLVTARATLE